MKTVLLLAALALLLPGLPARAGDDGPSWTVLVVDKDPKGANVRESPSGRVVKVIPFADNGGPRLVKLVGQSGRWFKVEVGGTVGWMHASVLGICASPTEDGAPVLSKRPDNGSPPGARVPSGAPVHLLGMQGRWLQVGYVDATGTNHDGWLPEQAVVMSESGREACARAWAGR